MNFPFISSKKQNSKRYEALKNKWENRYKELQDNLWLKHADTLHWFLSTSRQWSVGTLTGLLLLASSGNLTSASGPAVVKEKPFKDLGSQSALILDLTRFLPQTVQPLDQDAEQQVADILTQHLGVTVTPQLQGIRLNASYGYIGQEQHLARYPGDNMEVHLETNQDINKYYQYGMAPGLGGWGYFARSQVEMTTQDSIREKYYIAVQTFLAPGYRNDVKRYNDFFRYRKMLVVNPQNGRAIVADIADAGPSPWTGKQLGGSPEVMNYLQRFDGAQKGPVLYFFIDDPTDQVSLGPVAL